jgi:hypothetical protein
MTWGTLSKFTTSTPDHRLSLPRVGHMQTAELVTPEMCDIVEQKSNIFWQFEDLI